MRIIDLYLGYFSGDELRWTSRTWKNFFRKTDYIISQKRLTTDYKATIKTGSNTLEIDYTPDRTTTAYTRGRRGKRVTLVEVSEPNRLEYRGDLSEMGPLIRSRRDFRRHARRMVDLATLASGDIRPA